MSVLATVLGYPRIGAARELKQALEGYWSKKTPAGELLAVAAELRRRHWQAMTQAGLDRVPVNDFSLYDHVLDMATTVGAVPARYARIEDPLERYFAMARGSQDAATGLDLNALEMTKWFDTNYHYIVPELDGASHFELEPRKIMAELAEAQALGLEPRPVLLGPVSFLLLAKPSASDRTTLLALLPKLLPVYEELLALLAARSVRWVQLDEPCLVLDLPEPALAAYEMSLPRLSALEERPRLLLTTYFGALNENLGLAARSGCEGLHVDLVQAPEQLDDVLRVLPPAATLSLGVIDGRNVWRADLDAAHRLVRRAVSARGAEQVLVAPSCSLLHVPIDLALERGLDAELRGFLAFAEQKLVELRALADAATDEVPRGRAFEEARAATEARRASPRTRKPEVRARAHSVTPSLLRRTSPFPVRRELQHARFRLPPLPATTIGSFPQTAEVRAARAAFRAGRKSREEYERFLRAEIRSCIARQEAIGLDVLVHGEFERNDMVEYFGERLEGFAFTEHGWVQSYGSRCVKPPLLYGDVSRQEPITTPWSVYAQSLTARPVKGMLTGPVTILKWSFVRDDQPRSETARQIALALRDEVLDLEAAGIAVIQVDEPALREGLPLRLRERDAYLRWAVDAFRLATSGVRDETQIHTHLCYSEFGDILEAIAAMDADVLSIESSRSKMELLGDFQRFRYPNEVGPGVYDIHSPRVPSREEMLGLIQRAARVLPVRSLWVNPDCGLKTRAWPEVEAALTEMVEAARAARRLLAIEQP